jgi:DNA polymerase-3 subunit delta
MTAQEILQDLKQNRYSPLYFLQGEEPFFIDQVSDYIEAHALSDGEKGFNQTVMYGKEAKLPQVIEASRRFPMMAQRQVIIVKEAQEMQDLGKKDAQERFAKYVENPVPSTVLVICHKHKKLDGKTKLAKVLKQKAVFLDTKKLYDNEVFPWVKNYCKEQGLKVTEQAALLLAESIGNNLHRIANEISKVLLTHDKEKEINEDEILEKVGISRDFNVFELQKALGIKDRFKAFQIANHFAANPKDNPLIATVTVLFNFFSKLMVYHQNKTKPKQELAKLMGVNPYFLRDYAAASSKYPLAKNVRVISYLREADLHSKGIEGTVDDKKILTELIYKIMH